MCEKVDLTVQGFEQVLKEDRLIYGVLKALNINPRRADYEDLAQMCRLLYVENYVRAAEKTVSFELTTFKKQVFQQLKWRVLDYLRRESHYTQQVASTDETTVLDNQPLAWGTGETVTLDQRLAQTEQLIQLFANCTTIEKQYIQLVLQQSATTPMLMTHLGLSQRQVYALKTKIQKKAQFLFGSEH